MAGIGSMLEIGKKSLFANQAAIEVVGNNISNANTPGYSRQAVRLEDGMYISSSPGQLGTGVNAVEVVRYFDEFIEAQYLDKSSDEARWQTLYENLKNVEMVLNESSTDGVNSALAAFWADWQTLASNPEDTSARSALLGHAANLVSAVQSVQGDLQRLQDGADDVISAEVTAINKLLTGIAELNRQITVTEETGKNNANGLRDERTQLVRQLAEKMDINVIDNGLGNLTITTTAGHTLVDGSNSFRLAFEAPQTIANLKSGSSFKGSIAYDGESATEYTVKIVSQVGSVVKYEVYIDGGKTLLKDESGNSEFTASKDGILMPDGRGVLKFDIGTGTSLQAGDTFQVLPNKSLFWYETSSSKVNITPQVQSNGLDNDRRLTGGSLAGYFQFRDAGIGGYLEKLDAFAESLSWEVNRLHSQGTGMERFENVIGSFGVGSTSAALGSAAGLVFGDKLAAGNLVISVYNEQTGQIVQSSPLDFDFDATNLEVKNFSTTNSLQDVVNAVNAAFPSGTVTADIIDGHLQIKAKDGYDFAFGSDSTGLLAALGINTFFEGANAGDLAINSTILGNIAYINTGHVNGAGEMNEGDNTTAKAIAALQSASVSTRTQSEGTTQQTLGEYYSTIVAKAGSDTQSAKFNYEYNEALATDLLSRQESVSGVNLDEEMTNLIKFQHAYTAAAKLITTAESMLQVLLGLKQ
ncbi:flagellar hook-associated protein FlgK [Desulfomicrobium escambiense]|uniref:flagellar hook-associated protein FlgK n=1 Tax=Desulfomicrobium escambiense TaxID=29503 RepID=UPI000427C8D8|nr:flagellar hook-associated protein FlgK [Desulfomicrobium escambiense]